LSDIGDCLFNIHTYSPRLETIIHILKVLNAVVIRDTLNVGWKGSA